jgi:hypothetical protein
MAANARRVSVAATALAHLLPSELSALLDNRATGLSEQRKFTVIASTAAMVVGLALLWLEIVGWLRRRPLVRVGLAGLCRGGSRLPPRKRQHSKLDIR